MAFARAEIVSNVWKLVARQGDQVGPDDVVAVLESMKMEIPLRAGVSGHVSEILVQEGQIVQEGDPIMEIDVTPSA